MQPSDPRRVEIVQVTGAPGAGVSSVARALAHALRARVLDLDDVHWLATDPPYTAHREPAQKLHHLRQQLHDGGRLVLAGSLVGWGDAIAPQLGACLHLRCATEVRMQRIREREADRFAGKVAPGGEMHGRHLAFLQWAQAYDGRRAHEDARSQEADLLWLARLPCPALMLSSDRLAALECAACMHAFLARVADARQP